MIGKKNKICFQYKELDKHEIRAIKALHAGEATPHQQGLALAVIVNNLSRAQDLLYIPDSFDETAFMNGRAYVGQKILKIINVPTAKLLKKDEAETDVDKSE